MGMLGCFSLWTSRSRPIFASSRNGRFKLATKKFILPAHSTLVLFSAVFIQTLFATRHRTILIDHCRIVRETSFGL